MAITAPPGTRTAIGSRECITDPGTQVTDRAHQMDATILDAQVTETP